MVSRRDKYAANRVAERMLQNEREGWEIAEEDCDAHVAATMQDKCMRGQLDWAVTGLIRVALMIKPYMHRWQRCLAAEIEASLQVREGPPPLSAMRHRARMLHLFAGEGAIGVLRWLMMSVLPNGR